MVITRIMQGEDSALDVEVNDDYVHIAVKYRILLDEGSVEEAMFGSDKWHTDPDAGLVVDKHLLPQLIAALQGAL